MTTPTHPTVASLRIASKASLKRADESLRQELLERLIDCRLMTPSMQLMYNFDPERLPMRELPHGNWSELFILYKAFVRTKLDEHNGGAACRATFFKVARRWKPCLKFHQQSHHAQCSTCSRMRAALQGTSEPCPISILSLYEPVF